MKLKIKPVLLESVERRCVLEQSVADRGAQSAPVEQQRFPSSSEAEAAEGHQPFLLLLLVFGKFSPQLFCIYSLWWSLPLLQTSKKEMFPRTLYFPHIPAKTSPNLTDATKAMRWYKQRPGTEWGEVVVLTTPNTSKLYNEKNRTVLSLHCRGACWNLMLLGNSRSVSSSKNIVM